MMATSFWAWLSRKPTAPCASATRPVGGVWSPSTRSKGPSKPSRIRSNSTPI